jgi:hypothetical protein
LEQQQQARPLADVAGDERRQLLDTMTQGPVTPEYDVFSPTRRPAEPITAGVPVGPGPGSLVGDNLRTDPNVLLQAMISVYPHPVLMALLDRGD